MPSQDTGVSLHMAQVGGAEYLAAIERNELPGVAAINIFVAMRNAGAAGRFPVTSESVYATQFSRTLRAISSAKPLTATVFAEEYRAQTRRLLDSLSALQTSLIRAHQIQRIKALLDAGQLREAAQLAAEVAR